MSNSLLSSFNLARIKVIDGEDDPDLLGQIAKRCLGFNLICNQPCVFGNGGTQRISWLALGHLACGKPEIALLKSASAALASTEAAGSLAIRTEAPMLKQATIAREVSLDVVFIARSDLFTAATGSEPCRSSNA